MIELSPYRIPHWGPILRRSLNYTKYFIVNAGPIIFLVNAVIWFLGYFPNGAGNLETSWLAQISQFISPLFEATLGLDWKYGIAIITSFLAREVFIGTLGTLLGISNAEDNIVTLSDAIVQNGMTFSSGFALLIFYTIALQCISTVSVLRKEIKNPAYGTYILIFYTVLAFVLSFLAKHFY